ncbi:MAG: antibiotic biosynthesis monooxygenase family protein [Ketobacteraceae bacterium]|nr:antibiotic biosynthesis monooxygenase family protein [Ketobacteraceae bacterium]
MIKVIIERKVIPGAEAHYKQAVTNLMRAIEEAPGFVTGETYHELNRPNHFIVIANWQSLSHWKRWLNSRQRRSAVREIAPFMEREEKFTVLERQVYRPD